MGNAQTKDQFVKANLPKVVKRFVAVKEKYGEELQMYIDNLMSSTIYKKDLDIRTGYAVFRLVYKDDRAEFFMRTGYRHPSWYDELFLEAMKESGIYEMIKTKEDVS